MSNHRLFELLYYLLEHPKTNAQTLADYFEVSKRTIYRDLQALIVASVPVYCKPGHDGGVYLDEDFVLDKTILSKEEQLELLTSIQLSSNLKKIAIY